MIFAYHQTYTHLQFVDIIEIDYMKQDRPVLKVLAARVLLGECFCFTSVRFPIYLVM